MYATHYPAFFVYRMKTLFMKTAIIPASFLSVAFPVERKLLRTDNSLFIIREESINESSRLYSLFFGALQKQTAKVKTETVDTEPDYYNNYE